MMQKNDVNVADLPKDTVLRIYEPMAFEYKVQPNDILSITFESLTEEKYDFLAEKDVQQLGSNLAGGGALLIGKLVDADGEITLPVIGRFKVAGYTVFQIQERLQKIAEQYLRDPIVVVKHLNFRVTLLGEVAKEGTIPLFNTKVTMLEAIGQAGGLGELADRSNIKIIRQIGGKTEIQYINLLDEDFLNSPYYFVNQNDVVIVPALKQRPFRRYAGQNLSLIVSTISLLLLTFNLTK